MALRKLKPTTPGQRGASVPDFAEITRTTPEKSLVRPIHSKGGRNNLGDEQFVTKVAVTSVLTV